MQVHCEGYTEDDDTWEPVKSSTTHIPRHSLALLHAILLQMQRQKGSLNVLPSRCAWQISGLGHALRHVHTFEKSKKTPLNKVRCRTWWRICVRSRFNRLAACVPFLTPPFAKINRLMFAESGSAESYHEEPAVRDMWLEAKALLRPPC